MIKIIKTLVLALLVSGLNAQQNVELAIELEETSEVGVKIIKIILFKLKKMEGIL